MKKIYSEKIIEDKFTWKKILKEISKKKSYDIYHKYEYANLYKKPSDKVIAYYCKYKENFLFVALIIKKIKDTNYFDFETPYGYSGPICHYTDENLIHELLNNFFKFLKKNKIICGIIRTAFRETNFFPYNEKNFKLINSSKIIILNKNTTLNLARQEYAKDLKTNLRKAEKYNLINTFSNDKEKLFNFSLIYLERMRELNAKSFYLFDHIYFEKLFQIPKENWKVLSCFYDKNLVGGAILFQSKDIYSVHLTAALRKFQHLYVNEKIRDSIVNNFFESTNSYLNFGGGRSSDENDGLFKFKKKFSSLNSNFCLYGIELEPHVLKKIKENWIAKNQKSKYKDFFLNYRY